MPPTSDVDAVSASDEVHYKSADYGHESSAAAPCKHYSRRPPHARLEPNFGKDGGPTTRSPTARSPALRASMPSAAPRRIASRRRRRLSLTASESAAFASARRRVSYKGSGSAPVARGVHLASSRESHSRAPLFKTYTELASDCYNRNAGQTPGFLDRVKDCGS